MNPDLPADPFAEAAAAAEAAARPPFYKRRSLLVAAGVLVVVAVTVVTDLPAQGSRTSDISAETTVMQQTNQDLSSCSYAVHEAFEIWQDRENDTLSDHDLAMSPQLLTQDQEACSFASQDDGIFELNDIEIPTTPAGKKLSDLVSVATLWASSDGVRAINEIANLISDPTNAADLAHLATAEQALAGDRARAEADEAAADHLLATRLPAPDLPATPVPRDSTA